jgi:NAD(P)H-hydrate epimerase|tara:strand:- start:783 stop:2354 length:1572 start_codon:yes stop_codon:yes gene_type:complete
MKVVSSDQMRVIENFAFKKGLNPEILMQNAGSAIAKEIDRRFGAAETSKVLFLIGSGNNAKDGLIVSSELLKKTSYEITIILLTGTLSDSMGFLEKQGLIRSDVKIFDIDDLENNFRKISISLLDINVIVDAIFGIGLSRKIKDPLKSRIKNIQNLLNEDIPCVAVDIPSGVNSDTGAIDEIILKADLTLALGYPKLAHYTQPAASFCGEIKVLDIGVTDQEMQDVHLNLITEKFVTSKIPIRDAKANKGTFGKVMIVGGSDEFIGAPALAGIAAAKAGAGLITSSIPRSIVSHFTYLFPEATLIQLPETQNHTDGWIAARLIHKELGKYSVMLIGCGLGVSRKTSNMVENLLLTNIDLPKLVIDADALNILSNTSNWWSRISNNAILTPHPGEMSRLTQLPIEHIQSNRLNVAKEFSYQWNKTVVLKGANTVVSTPDGKSWVSEFANPALASAGTGDVLAGIITGLLAQKMSIENAAILGVYIHGIAGKIFKKQSGLMARDLLDHIPVIMDQLRKHRKFPFD